MKIQVNATFLIIISLGASIGIHTRTIKISIPVVVGRRFLVTDDTLEISGGLYDGPQVYNSTVTVLNEDQTYTAT